MNIEDFFYENNIIDLSFFNFRNPIDAIALRSTVLLVVQKQPIKNIFAENNEFYNEMANVLAERQVKLGEATLLPEEKSKEVNKLANKIGEAILRFFS